MFSSGNAGLRLSMSLLLIALYAGGAVVVLAAVGAGSVVGAGVATIRLERPEALAVGPGGQVYIADVERNQILELVPGDSFKVVAGTGKAGFSGDGGPAVDARLNAPGGMAVGANGTLYVADSGNMRVRAISPRGIISTIAGNGTFGWVTTGTPARAARLGWPAALTIGPHGDLYIAAEGSGEVLRLGANGLLVRVAGIRGPFAGVYGIGRPATQASADGPNGLAFDRAGNLYIAGVNTKTLLMVTPGGRMVLPMGQDGFYPRGDGGLVTAPDGSMIAMDGQKIVRLSPRGARTILNLGGRRIDGISGFLPDGIAAAPTGDIFADTYLGNGLANKTALIEVRPGGRIQVLWKS